MQGSDDLFWQFKTIFRNKAEKYCLFFSQMCQKALHCFYGDFGMNSHM
jgi:hypothetical protein